MLPILFSDVNGPTETIHLSKVNIDRARNFSKSSFTSFASELSVYVQCIRVTDTFVGKAIESESK